MGSAHDSRRLHRAEIVSLSGRPCERLVYLQCRGVACSKSAGWRGVSRCRMGARWSGARARSKIAKVHVWLKDGNASVLNTHSWMLLAPPPRVAHARNRATAVDVGPSSIYVGPNLVDSGAKLCDVPQGNRSKLVDSGTIAAGVGKKGQIHLELCQICARFGSIPDPKSVEHGLALA